MQKIHNEQGYALLIVLFLVVFIMAVSAVFIRGSLGNAKQEIKVDESHLTVMAAEAGVDYYKIELSNEYYNKIPKLEEFIVAEIADFAIKKEEIDVLNIRQNTVTELETILSEKKDNLELGNTINDKYSFILDDIQIKSNTSIFEVEVSGSVIGINDTGEKTASITFSEKFSVPEIVMNIPNGEGIDSPGKGSIKFDIYNLYTEPLTPINNCKKGKSIQNEECKSASPDSNNVDEIKNNSTVYFPNGRWAVTNDFEIKTNSMVLINAYIGSNKLDVKDSIVLVNGTVSASAKSEIKDNSFFAMNGASDFLNQLSIKDGATVFLRGSNRFYDNLIVKNNAKLCIAGSATIVKDLIIKNGGSLYVYKGPGDHGVKFNKIEGEVIEVESMEDLIKKCPVNIQDKVYEKSIWGKPVITNVDYQ